MRTDSATDLCLFIYLLFCYFHELHIQLKSSIELSLFQAELLL